MNPVQQLALDLNTTNKHKALDECVANEYAEAVKQSFIRNYTTNDVCEKESPALRVSSLGKPTVLQALSVLGYKETDTIEGKLNHIFHTGDLFEALAIAVAKGRCYHVADEQAEVEFEGVKGHIDFILNNTLVEVKTMSSQYHLKFSKNPNDDRGYITQLAVYSHCLGLSGNWLALNKGTHTVTSIEPDEDVLQAALARVKRILPFLRNLDSFKDVIEKIPCPPPVYDKRSGLYVVPESMKWSVFAPVFYEIEPVLVGKTLKHAVVSINDTHKAKENLNALTREELVTWKQSTKTLTPSYTTLQEPTLSGTSLT